MTTTTVLEALKRLEDANNVLCALRTEEMYLSMLNAGQQDALIELDNARSAARATIRAAKPDQVDATAQNPHSYILETGHGSGWRKTLDGVASEVRHLWTPLYDHPAAAQPVQPITDEREAIRNAALEEAAKACELISVERWGRYKHGESPDRANPYVEGQTDGADLCATAIRSLQSPHIEVREQAPEKVGRMG